MVAPIMNMNQPKKIKFSGMLSAKHGFFASIIKNAKIRE